MGPAGALVITAAGETWVPLYRTERVWKLGSGDVFSSTFAALWGCNGIDPVRAADCASRATAYYCDTRTLPRSEEHTSELQSLMRISYAVFCLKKKTILLTFIIDMDSYQHL